MVDHRTIATAGLAAGGVALASSSATASPTITFIEDFSNWPGENLLGEYSDAGEFENGGGSGEVSDGVLRLEYDDAGWFLSNLRSSFSAELVLTIAGDEGGEEDDITLEVGNVRDTLSNLTSDSIGTSMSPVRIDLTDVGVESGRVQDIWLTFWNAGSGAVEISSIDVESGFPEPGPDVNGDGNDAQDLSGDGLYEDVTGDGDLGFNDVVEFFDNHEEDVVQDNVDMFDFDGSGSVSFNDVIELFEMI